MHSFTFISVRNDTVFLVAKIHPKASSEKIVVSDDSFNIYVKSPPDKGKANLAVLKFLSKFLTISSSSMTIIKGNTSRTKTILIKGTSKEHIETKIKNQCY
ncbi:MAG: DUF167 domain-containing protein [Candidatus Heimdallarchaeota archaeon]|nr:DUF167 domain-containing protein [Candidatus Heimdallarchaeota archaeon]